MTDIRIIKARSALITSQPFFGALIMWMRMKEMEECGTMATDGTYIYYAPSFLDRITPEELKGVLAHETLHNAYLHHCRRQDRDPTLWNIAADYVINLDLIQAGFKLPKDALIDQQYRGMSAEEVYNRLKQNAKTVKVAMGACGKDGEGKVGPGAWGRVLDAAPPGATGKLGQQEEDWGRIVRQAIAAAQNAGTVPGNLQQMIDAIKKPKISWKEELRRFIDDRSRYDYAWTRPNKRFLNSGFVLPGIEPNSIFKLGVVLDTSGSVDDDLVAQFLSELESAVDCGSANEVVVIQCDTKVQRVDYYQAGDQMRPPICGRGGTAFSPAFEWFHENAPDTSVLIYMTDLQCHDFGPEPAIPVLWGAFGHASEIESLAKNVPFGEVIAITN